MSETLCTWNIPDTAGMKTLEEFIGDAPNRANRLRNRILDDATLPEQTTQFAKQVEKFMGEPWLQPYHTEEYPLGVYLSRAPTARYPGEIICQPKRWRDECWEWLEPRWHKKSEYIGADMSLISPEIHGVKVIIQPPGAGLYENSASSVISVQAQVHIDTTHYPPMPDKTLLRVLPTGLGIDLLYDLAIRKKIRELKAKISKQKVV